MAQNRTVEEKTADTALAFNVLRAEITPQQLRDVVVALTTIKPPESDASMRDVEAYASLVRSSMDLARIVAANDRAAMLAAATITQSGVSRPVYTTEGDVE